jgi:hypothetical protein
MISSINIVNLPFLSTLDRRRLGGRYSWGLVQLLLKNRFNLADFLLDFSGKFFVLAVGCQAGIVRELSRFLFGLAFQFMQLAFDLIVRARFHVFLLFSLGVRRDFFNRVSHIGIGNPAPNPRAVRYGIS